jgi:hypothetical protein
MPRDSGDNPALVCPLPLCEIDLDTLLASPLRTQHFFHHFSQSVPDDQGPAAQTLSINSPAFSTIPINLAPLARPKCTALQQQTLKLPSRFSTGRIVASAYLGELQARPTGTNKKDSRVDETQRSTGSAQQDLCCQDRALSLLNGLQLAGLICPLCSPQHFVEQAVIVKVLTCCNRAHFLGNSTKVATTTHHCNIHK